MAMSLIYLFALNKYKVHARVLQTCKSIFIELSNHFEPNRIPPSDSCSHSLRIILCRILNTSSSFPLYVSLTVDT